MDIDPEKRQGLLEAAALGGEETIAGLALRPMTAASWSLHQRLKRAAGELDGEDWSFNIFSFAYIHSQPVAKLRASYARPETLLGEVFDFMAERGPADAMLWKPWFERQMEQFSASITQALSAEPEISDASPKV
ncbi:MAG: hypothetical protein EBR82_36280 [Caulobacteraceae bacterium]|nr:hypothetical protein [Caulobacteraceae bacterium]